MRDPVKAIDRNVITTSDKYQFHSSEDLIQLFTEYGYEHTSTIRHGVRNEANEGFQKHIMRFKVAEIDPGNNLELLVTNSHRGDSSLKFDLGVFRLICTNGLIAGDKLFHERIPHKGKNFFDKVALAINSFSEVIPQAVDNIRRMQGTEVTPEQMSFYAQQVMEKLFIPQQEEGKNIAVRFSSLAPRRQEDNAPTAYNVFNVIQEAVIKGGVKYVTSKEDDKGQLVHKNNSTRIIRSVDRITEMNKYCWDVAQEILLKVAA